jgi:hypothetical protein
MARSRALWECTTRSAIALGAIFGIMLSQVLSLLLHLFMGIS